MLCGTALCSMILDGLPIGFSMFRIRTQKKQKESWEQVRPSLHRVIHTICLRVALHCLLHHCFMSCNIFIDFAYCNPYFDQDR